MNSVFGMVRMKGTPVVRAFEWPCNPRRKLLFTNKTLSAKCDHTSLSFSQTDIPEIDFMWNCTVCGKTHIVINLPCPKIIYHIQRLIYFIQKLINIYHIRNSFTVSKIHLPYPKARTILHLGTVQRLTAFEGNLIIINLEERKKSIILTYQQLLSLNWSYWTWKLENFHEHINSQRVWFDHDWWALK